MLHCSLDGVSKSVKLTASNLNEGVMWLKNAYMKNESVVVPDNAIPSSINSEGHENHSMLSLDQELWLRWLSSMSFLCSPNSSDRCSCELERVCLFFQDIGILNCPTEYGKHLAAVLDDLVEAEKGSRSGSDFRSTFSYSQFFGEWYGNSERIIVEVVFNEVLPCAFKNCI